VVRLSDDWDRWRGFCEPIMLSRLKLGVRCALRFVGDRSPAAAPFGRPARVTGPMSPEKVSREGAENCLPEAPGTDIGESPVEDGDMTRVIKWSCVDEVVMKVTVRRGDGGAPKGKEKEESKPRLFL
jgi:hypothetical protein